MTEGGAQAIPPTKTHVDTVILLYPVWVVANIMDNPHVAKG
jgi:hypothetical protein